MPHKVGKPSHRLRFRDPCNRTRRLVTTVAGPTQDWNALLYYNVPHGDFPGYVPETYPGGMPEWTRAEYNRLVQQAIVLGLPIPAPLPMYKDEFQSILLEAQKYLGNSYRWGGKTPPNFDCSGFVGWCYKIAGFVPMDVVSYTGTLWKYFQPVSSPYYGDIVLWNDPDSGTPDGPQAHVAIFLGGTNIIDSARGGVAYRHVYETNPLFNGYYRLPGR